MFGNAEQICPVFADIEADNTAHIDVFIPEWGDVAENLIGRNRLACVDR
jgi:hypothetical protein